MFHFVEGNLEQNSDRERNGLLIALQINLLSIKHLTNTYTVLFQKISESNVRAVVCGLGYLFHSLDLNLRPAPPLHVRPPTILLKPGSAKSQGHTVWAQFRVLGIMAVLVFRTVTLQALKLIPIHDPK